MKRKLHAVISTFALVITILGSPRLLLAAEEITYFHNDALGSPVAATSSTGRVLWAEAYKPFGERIIQDGLAASHRQWFTGHAEDAETRLVYMGARHYDPLVGRFMAMDPAGVREADPHTFNRYAYAVNNPYRYIDPDGREAKATKDSTESTGWIERTLDGITDRIKENLKKGLDFPGPDQFLRYDRGEMTPEEQAKFEERRAELVEALIPFGGATKIVLKGGHKMTQAAADALNEYMGTNYHRRELGRGLEKLRKGLRKDDHGALFEDGEAFRKNGRYLGNLWEVMP